mgnify:CR=1 FL=1
MLSSSQLYAQEFSAIFHPFGTEYDLERRHPEAVQTLVNLTGYVAHVDELREALRIAPAELLLVETDAPFLTPHPHRGRPNAPYLIPLTLRGMAETRGDDVDALARAVSENTARVYGAF